MAHKKGISFVIPAYNEEASVSITITRLDEILATLGRPYEIILVNDGSSDNTLANARQCGKARVISHPTNSGYGRSIKTGVIAAKYEWIGLTDADGTYPIQDIPRLVDEMDRGFDMVVGARNNIKELDSVQKSIFRFIFKMLVFLSAGNNRVLDANSGLRIFSRSIVISFMPLLCDTFSFTTSLTILAFGDGLFVSYVPINYLKRHGESKVRHLRDSIYAINLMVEGISYFNPLKIFLILLALAVLLVCIPAMSLAVLHMPTLSLYYMIFGSIVTILVALGVLGNIIRLSQIVREGKILSNLDCDNHHFGLNSDVGNG
jgi:glycosyltransferase involved in cell wall biosynthesis